MMPSQMPMGEKEHLEEVAPSAWEQHQCRQISKPLFRNTSVLETSRVELAKDIGRRSISGPTGAEEVPIEQLSRQDIRDFLDWVHEQAVEKDQSNPGRTANKARENLRAVMSWAWERDMVEVLPRFPKPRPHRRVAGRHFLTKAEINALYFATHKMERPRGWHQTVPVGRYWRSALVIFYNYGLDTGTVWQSEPIHQPIRWRHVTWEPETPDREMKQRSRWRWLFYRRIKTNKTFYRPMNRTVHAHLKSIMPNRPDPNAPVFLGGGTRTELAIPKTMCLGGSQPKEGYRDWRGKALADQRP